MPLDAFLNIVRWIDGLMRIRAGAVAARVRCVLIEPKSPYEFTAATEKNRTASAVAMLKNLRPNGACPKSEHNGWWPIHQLQITLRRTLLPCNCPRIYPRMSGNGCLEPRRPWFEASPAVEAIHVQSIQHDEHEQIDVRARHSPAFKIGVPTGIATERIIAAAACVGGNPLTIVANSWRPNTAGGEVVTPTTDAARPSTARLSDRPNRYPIGPCLKRRKALTRVLLHEPAVGPRRHQDAHP
jgi:hypothetical protein